MPKRLSTEEFIKKAKTVHGCKYDYSETIYTGSKNKLTITCKVHGDIEILPMLHINYSGCSKCSRILANDSHRTNVNEIINKCRITHGGLYDYSMVTQPRNIRDNATIICPKHGTFKQSLKDHSRGSGCPICRESKGERQIRLLLTKYSVSFKTQFTFDDCSDVRKLPFDFYIPKLNILIEYDGIQHFKPVNRFGGQSAYLTTIKHDIIKDTFCNEKGIRLIRIPYWNITNIDVLLSNIICTKQTH